jgi:hypothetical protein
LRVCSTPDTPNFAVEQAQCMAFLQGVREGMTYDDTRIVQFATAWPAGVAKRMFCIPASVTLVEMRENYKEVMLQHPTYRGARQRV